MPAKDDFQSHTPNTQSPVSHALAITPNDGVDLAYVSRAIFLGTGGDLTVLMADGSPASFVNMAPGWHPIRVGRVMATGTTADHIVGCW